MSDTAKPLLQWAVAQLTPVLDDNAATDARILLAHAMKIDRGILSARLSDAISPEQAKRFRASIALRLKRQPVSQIIGMREFWGRCFCVTPDVLDPRPDTETLIAAVLQSGPAPKLLDLGIGSGCILLTLLAEWPDAHGVGIDKSTKALQVAEINAQSLGVAKRAVLIRSDWFSNVTGQFDLIVCNPPYISAEAMQSVAPEVRDWEPRIALTPEGDGLDDYRKIATGAAPYLSAQGQLFLEIGWDQARAVQKIFTDHGYTMARCFQDIAGKDRVLCFKAINSDKNSL